MDSDNRAYSNPYNRAVSRLRWEYAERFEELLAEEREKSGLEARKRTGPRRRRLTPAEREEVRENVEALIAKGFDYKAAGKAVGVSTGTAWHLVNGYGRKGDKESPEREG